MRPTYLTINTSLVRENLRKIKDSLPEWSTSTAVIKANGYGHGSVMMGRIAVEEGYESLAVAIPEESVSTSQRWDYGTNLSTWPHKTSVL